MLRYLFGALGLGAALAAGAQNDIFDAAEFMPVAPGCTRVSGPDTGECTLRFIHSTVSTALVWPASCARHAGGTLLLSLVVDDRGQVTAAEVLRSLHPDLDRAAATAALKLPLLQPASEDGKPVKVRITVPLKLTPPAPQRP